MNTYERPMDLLILKELRKWLFVSAERKGDSVEERVRDVLSGQFHNQPYHRIQQVSTKLSSIIRMKCGK